MCVFVCVCILCFLKIPDYRPALDDVSFSFQEVHVHVLDMSETRKVWEFAEAFRKQYPSLNVLVSRPPPILSKIGRASCRERV